jgi:hypothetical protein
LDLNSSKFQLLDLSLKHYSGHFNYHYSLQNNFNFIYDACNYTVRFGRSGVWFKNMMLKAQFVRLVKFHHWSTVEKSTMQEWEEVEKKLCDLFLDVKFISPIYRKLCCWNILKLTVCYFFKMSLIFMHLNNISNNFEIVCNFTQMIYMI